MADRQTPDDDMRQAADEANDGSATDSRLERGAGQDQDNAGGITNRPLREERENQASLPPRGERQDPDDAA
jgi:hypothetical protein